MTLLWLSLHSASRSSTAPFPTWRAGLRALTARLWSAVACPGQASRLGKSLLHSPIMWLQAALTLNGYPVWRNLPFLTHPLQQQMGCAGFVAMHVLLAHLPDAAGRRADEHRCHL